MSKVNRRFASFTASSGYKFFLWGGRQDPEEVNQVPLFWLHSFDFLEEKWVDEFVDGQQPPGIGFGSCAADGPFVYVYGGEDEDEDFSGSLFKIDTEALLFTELSSSSRGNVVNPKKKNDSGMVVYKGNVYLFGGKFKTDPDRRTDELHMFDVDQEKWVLLSATGAIPSPRSGFSFVKMNDHTVVLFGGYFGYEHYSNDVYILDLETQIWTEIPHRREDKWPIPRRAHSAAVLGYGSDRAEMIVIGGKCELKTLNEIWKLNLTSWKWTELPISGHTIFKRRWHMCGCRQISENICEVVIFGGVRERNIISETALIIFEHDQWDNTWIIKEIVKSNQLGEAGRLQKKAEQNALKKIGTKKTFSAVEFATTIKVDRKPGKALDLPHAEKDFKKFGTSLLKIAIICAFFSVLYYIFVHPNLFSK